MERVNAKTLKGAIKEVRHKESCIMTDEWAAYMCIGDDFNGDEFSFRWNYRKSTDGERALAVIVASSGKRFGYKPLVAQSLPA